MKKFLYKAVSQEGKLIKGEMDERTSQDVEKKLKDKGYDILNISVEETEKKDELNLNNIKFFKRKKSIRKSEKVFLYKNIASMLKAGLPMLEVVGLLKEDVNNDSLRNVLKNLKVDVEGGGYISSTFERYPDMFSEGEVSVIKAGEASGTLPESFYELYVDTKAEDDLRKDIKNAMMYPAIIMSILVLVSTLLFVYVIPQMTSFFVESNIEIPTITKIIIAVSGFMKNNFLVLTLGFVITIVTLRSMVRKSVKFKRSFDKFILKVPWLGKQIMRFNVYRFTRMLSSLIRSGIPILQALEIASKSISHTGYRRSIEETRKVVKKGVEISSAISKYDKLYPSFVGRMLKFGDKTGNIDEALNNVSEQYQQELEDTLANISTIIEPVLMVILGVGVAFVAISVLIPMYKVVSGINQLS